MVSGGPYGIEDILGGAGYLWAIIILLLLPFFWSLPTTLMIGELASAIPAEGGFYVWVRRALGPFWGFQESWLSLSASIFDMALYPSIFVLYLGKFNPRLRPIGAVISGPSLSLSFAARGIFSARPQWARTRSGCRLCCSRPSLSSSFSASGVASLCTQPCTGAARRAPGADVALSTAILVALWNYMGWDNASTVAQEVENPQRNYPRAMLGAATLTALTYILPLAAMAVAGLSPQGFTTGSWATAGAVIGGHVLVMAVVAGGVLCGVGMFNALMMSYIRLPIAMAADGFLPRIFIRRNRRGVPWVSVLVCGLGWALALNLPFERLISIDLILYGSSLILEFAALVVLRIREPNLERPFKAGNFTVACLLGVAPALLIAYALYASRDEKVIGNLSSLVFAAAIALLGPVLYWLAAGATRGALRAESVTQPAARSAQESLSSEQIAAQAIRRIPPLHLSPASCTGLLLMLRMLRMAIQI